MRLLIVTLLSTGAVAPLNFAPASGWHTGRTKAQPCSVSVSKARCVQASSWSSTLAWKGDAMATARALPSDGIVLSAIVSIEHPVRATRSVVWPAKITANQVGGLEGVPSRIGTYQLFARLADRREIYLTVFFGRAHPTKAQLARANARLASAKLEL